MNETGKIDYGQFVGAGLLVLMAVILGVGCFFAIRWHRDTERGEYMGDWGPSLGIAIAFGVLAPLPLLGSLAVLWPLDWDYLAWHRVDGKVEQVSSRLVAEGKGMSQRFVVVIDGRPYAVDDTRATLVKAGDSITLACKKEYQYAAESGWACNWGAP